MIKPNINLPIEYHIYSIILSILSINVGGTGGAALVKDAKPVDDL